MKITRVRCPRCKLMFDKVQFLEHLYSLSGEKCMDVAIETMLTFWWNGVAIPYETDEKTTDKG